MTHFQSPNAEPEGILLIAHGTREPEGVAEFLELAAEVAKAWPDRPLEPCFLELAEPTIEEAFGRLMNQGVKRLVAMPLLLFSAGHAKHDVPMELARLTADYPDIVLRQASHLGCHRALVKGSARRFTEAIEDAKLAHKSISLPETLLLLVGRGSSDEEATGEMLRFARLREKLTPVRRAEVAFMAMARPSLDQALSMLEPLAAQGIRRVVIQPHLLFGGRVLNAIRDKARQFAAEHPAIDVVVTEQLGISPPIVHAIVERIEAAFVEPVA